MDRLLEGARYPADVSAVLNAADETYAAGETDVAFGWPFMQRLPAPDQA